MPASTEPFRGSTVLVTGGTGSFGHAFLDHILPFGCREIRIFSRDELKQEEMRIAYANPLLKFHLGEELRLARPLASPSPRAPDRRRVSR